MELTDLQFAVQQQNKINEFEQGISDICILLSRPENTFRESDINDIRYIAETIIRMQKELKELREFKESINKVIPINDHANV